MTRALVSPLIIGPTYAIRSPRVATAPRYHGLPVPSTIRAFVMRISYAPVAPSRGTEAQATANPIARAEITLVILIRSIVGMLARGRRLTAAGCRLVLFSL